MPSTAEEAHRLLLQGEVYDPSTRRFLVEAGVSEGMRVLDVGSGPGAVSRVLARLVGPDGSVVGVEHDPAMVEVARRHAIEPHATFVCADAGAVELADLVAAREGTAAGASRAASSDAPRDALFDAIVGRFVLRELRDASAALRRLSRWLAPGGIVAFQEKVLAVPVTTVPRLALVEQVRGWMDQMRGLASVEVTTGATLVPLFVAAGLPAPELRFDAPVAYGPDGPGYAYLVATLRAMLPVMRLAGVADAETVGVDTLEERMRREAAEQRALLILTPCIGAWTRRPSRPAKSP